MKHFASYRLTFILLLFCTFLFSACRSGKHAVKESDTAGTTTDISVDEKGENKQTTKKKQIVARINENRQPARGIRGKMAISLQTGSKPLSTTGSIKMKRDEIIQISITALGLMELGRMELTPEYLFIQDRYHKRYLKARWDEIPSFQRANIDFTVFQALFWNELYVPGSSEQPSDEDFKQDSMGKKMKLQPKKSPKTINTLFYTNDARQLLQQTTLTTPDNSIRFDCLCPNWSTLNGKQFPASLQLIITAKGKKFSADFAFTHLQVDENMGNITTSVSEGKYTRVTLEEILKGLSM